MTEEKALALAQTFEMMAQVVINPNTPVKFRIEAAQWVIEHQPLVEAAMVVTLGASVKMCKDIIELSE